MLDALKQEVYEACMALPAYGLVRFCWGNVSGIDRQRGLVVIKPSGVPYDRLRPDDFPVVELESGRVVEGALRPSSDTPTHLELYRRFASVGGITHTHSVWATAFAQACRSLPPYGTTHADYFDGPVPCTRPMTEAEIDGAYELETGRVIAETFESRRIDPMRVPAVLVRSHAPFCWGDTPMASADCAAVLEYVAEMAFRTEAMQGERMPEQLLRRHFDRKHGPGAYYGQR